MKCFKSVRVAFFFIALFVPLPTPYGNLTAAGISSDEFLAIPTEKQRDKFRKYILDYRESCKNIEGVVVRYKETRSYDRRTGEVGTEILAEAKRIHDSLRRIGHSYRIVRRVNNPNTKNADLLVITTESYDAKLGVDRFLTERRSEVKTTYLGSIHSERLPPTSECFLYQFGGDNDQHLVNISPGSWFFVAGQTATMSRSKEGPSFIEASFPVPTKLTAEVGTVKLLIDTNKGGMISRLSIASNNPRQKRDRTYDLIVDDAENVKGVWIPTKIRGLGWLSDKPNQINIARYEVSDIRVGELKSDDLEVNFPPETRVIDKISGTRWLVGKNGEQLELIRDDSDQSEIK